MSVFTPASLSCTLIHRPKVELDAVLCGNVVQTNRHVALDVLRIVSVCCRYVCRHETGQIVLSAGQASRVTIFSGPERRDLRSVPS